MDVSFQFNQLLNDWYGQEKLKCLFKFHKIKRCCMHTWLIFLWWCTILELCEYEFFRGTDDKFHVRYANIAFNSVYRPEVRVADKKNTWFHASQNVYLKYPYPIIKTYHKTFRQKVDCFEFGISVRNLKSNKNLEINMPDALVDFNRRGNMYIILLSQILCLLMNTIGWLYSHCCKI